MRADVIQQVSPWAALLGVLFGIGVGMGFGGGWTLIDTASLPLLLSERLTNLGGIIVFGGFGAAVGMLWGLVCAILVSLRRRTMLIVGAFVVGMNGIHLLAWLGGLQGGGFPVATTYLGIPTLIGCGLLALYLFWNRPTLFLPLVVLVGFFFGHVPWSMNGRDTERAAYQTQTYAQQHQFTHYQISVTQAESGGYHTEIHLADGTVRYCYAPRSESEFKECIPTPP